MDTDTNFLNTGAVTLGNDAGDTVTFTGGLDTTTGPSGTNVAGIVQTTNTQMDLNGTTMLANTTLRSGTGAINIASITDGASSFTLSLGSATQTGAITTAGNATFNTLTTFANGYNIAFNGTTTTVDTDTNFLNTGAVTLGNDAGDTVTFTGGLDTTTGPSGTNVAGIVQTTNTQMDLNGTTMLANTTLRSGTGAINIASITDGASSFTLSLGSATQTGAITTAGNATFNTLTTFANGYNIAFNGTTTTVDTDTNFLNTGAVTLGNDAGDTVTFTGGLDTTTGPSGTNVAGIVQTTNTQMDLNGTTMLANTTLRSGTGAINIASITDGASSFTLSLGSATQTGAITTAGNATFNTLTTFANGYNIAFNGTTTTVDTDTNFLNTGAVTLGTDAGDTVTFTGGLDTTTGPSGTNVAGIVQTTNGQVDLGATAFTDNASVTAGASNLNIAGFTTVLGKNLALVAGLKLTLPAQAINTGAGSLILRSNGGTLATNGVITGSAVTLFGRDGLTIGHNVTANSLNLGTTAAAVQQAAGTLSVTTTTTVRDDTKAPGLDFVGVISLNQPGNDFQGAVNLQNSGANNVTISDKDGLDFGASTLGSGTFTVNAVGITQSGAIAQTAGAGLVTLTSNAGAVILAMANDFIGDVTATSGSSISLADINNLQVAVAGINTGTTLTLSTGGGITQLGAVIAPTLIVTAGGTVNLSLLAGNNGVNQVVNLGAVTVNGGDFVLFDQGGGLNLGDNITVTGGAKVVTTGGMTAGNFIVSANAVLSQVPGNDPLSASVVLVANHNSPLGSGGPNNFIASAGFNIQASNLSVIYVDTQSASQLGSFTPLDFSPNTVYTGSANNALNLVNGGRGNSILAIAGRLEANDQAGQLNIDDLFKKLQEMADPSRGALAFNADRDKRKKLAAQIAAFNKQRNAGGSGVGRYGPFQFLGYDFEDLLGAGFGTPEFDPTKLDAETTKSILQGLPLVGQ